VSLGKAADHSNLGDFDCGEFKKLCICEENSNLQSWAIKTVFVDLIPYLFNFRYYSIN